MKKIDFPHQKEDIEEIRKHNGIMYLCLDMGLGKTYETITYRKKYGPFNRPVIVVAPSSLKFNWRRECRMWGMKKTVILSTQTPPKEYPSKLSRRSGVVYIINYDIIQYWIPWLKKLNAGLILIDESQMLANRNSIRTQEVMKLAKRIPRRICMTGTPFMNNAADLWPSLHILWPDEFPSFWKYASRYCKVERTRWGLKFSGAKNLDKLHKKLKKLGMIRRLTEDTVDLPEKRIHVYVKPLTPEAQKEYAKAEGNYVRWLRGVAPQMSKAASRMKGLAKRLGLKQLAAKLRYKRITNYIDKFLRTKKGKLIVFGIHRNMLGPLHKKYLSQSVLVDGKCSSVEKELRTNKFKKNKKCRVLFGNLKAAGTGWNGTVANTVLIAEMWWNSAVHDQAMKRAHRIGQKKDVDVIFMVAENTIEHDLCRINQTKQGHADQAIDGLKKGKNRLALHQKLESAILRRRLNGSRLTLAQRKKNLILRRLRG